MRTIYNVKYVIINDQYDYVYKLSVVGNLFKSIYKTYQLYYTIFFLKFKKKILLT